MSRAIELGAVFLLVAVVIYLGWFVVRVSAGVSAEVPAADRLVRLQLVDAGGNPESAREVIRLLDHLADNHAQIRLVDQYAMDRHTVDATFIISREPDLSAARWLAHKLALGDDDVVYRPLENNHQQISATLVVGEDCDRIVQNLTPDQEM